MKPIILSLVMAAFVVLGCSKQGAAADALRQARAVTVANACVIYSSDHGGHFPKQLADLLPNNAPQGDCFAGLTPEQTIQGYDYFGNGAPAGETPGKIAGELWIPKYSLKTSDSPNTVILRMSEPLSDGRKAVVTIGGTVGFQPAK